MFNKKKKAPTEQFDRENFQPVLKCSICTSEQVAGFRNIHTGEFHDVMLIRNGTDLDAFREMYGVEVITKEY